MDREWLKRKKVMPDEGIRAAIARVKQETVEARVASTLREVVLYQ